jgi:hypothetical protein
MPILPSTYTANQLITAKQLNEDLYTYIPGNNHTPTGILFHSIPPMLIDGVWTNSLTVHSASGNGTDTGFESAGNWRNSYDSSCLFGPGADFAETYAAGHFNPLVSGSSGEDFEAGGNYLFLGNAQWGTTTNTGASGSVVYAGGVASSHGILQRSSTAHQNGSYVVDLVASGVGPTTTDYALGGSCSDASGSAYPLIPNTAGDFLSCCRFEVLWSGVDSGSLPPVQATLPVPQTWTSTSTVTSAGLNGSTGTGGALAFLNNPPQLRVSTSLTTSLTGSSSNQLLLTSPSIDSFSKWSGSAYVVPVAGVYLVHVMASVANFSGTVRVGWSVNGGTTVHYGPGYSTPTTSVLRPGATWLLDLNAGDSLTFWIEPSGSVALSSNQPCRAVIRWMSSLAASAGSVAWTPPDTGYRWQAGAPQSQLPGLLQQHLTNDLSFLLQKPYLLTQVTAASSSQTQSQWNLVQMGSATGLAHGSAGDNYGGWVSGASNYYQAIVPGWYLVVADYLQSAAGATASCWGGVGYATGTGAAQGSALEDVWQRVAATASGSYPPGADMLGMYYLRTGDRLIPYYSQYDGGSYTIQPGTTFGCVWVSE